MHAMSSWLLISEWRLMAGSGEGAANRQDEGGYHRGAAANRGQL